jgi:branched-chain amino acid transport system ATP-binding protein
MPVLAKQAEHPERSLEAEDVAVHFAGVRAVDGVALTLRRGAILGLIGPNGAGKTTLVNALTGFQTPTSGIVRIAGQDVTGWAPARLARAGLARTFQNVRLFPRLNVVDNIAVGALQLGLSRFKAEREAWSLLDRMGLAEFGLADANSVPHGAERRIGILRALAMRPSFLLLDEPAAGLNEAESDELVHTLAGLPDEYSLGLLVIEHDMRVIMSLCQTIQVIDYGRTIAVGPPDQIRSDPAVLAAYLGKKRASDVTR